MPHLGPLSSMETVICWRMGPNSAALQEHGDLGSRDPGGGHSLSGRLWPLVPFRSEFLQSQVWGLRGSSNVQNPWAVCGTKGGWGDLFVPPEQSQQG